MDGIGRFSSTRTVKVVAWLPFHWRDGEHRYRRGRSPITVAEVMVGKLRDVGVALVVGAPALFQLD